MGEQRTYYGRRVQSRGFICDQCGRMYVGQRERRTQGNYHSSACRQKAYRARKRQALDGAGGGGTGTTGG